MRKSEERKILTHFKRVLVRRVEYQVVASTRYEHHSRRFRGNWTLFLVLRTPFCFGFEDNSTVLSYEKRLYNIQTVHVVHYKCILSTCIPVPSVIGVRTTTGVVQRVVGLQQNCSKSKSDNERRSREWCHSQRQPKFNMTRRRESSVSETSWRQLRFAHLEVPE